MVSDNREISLISSIKSKLNNISHILIINSLRMQGENQREVWGLTPWREQSRLLWKSVKVGFLQFTATQQFST